MGWGHVEKQDNRVKTYDELQKEAWAIANRVAGLRNDEYLSDEWEGVRDRARQWKRDVDESFKEITKT